MGGSAGGGKTFFLLLEAARHINNSKFGAVIFRRERPDIVKEGGIWDESRKIYPELGGDPNRTDLKYTFPSGASIGFSQIQYEKDLEGWKSSQIALICFDEMTTFSEEMFWFMLGRNRTDCGIKPYFRGTTNPDPDSFVAKMIAWYIDQETGYYIPERSGVIRYFYKSGDDITWGNSKEEILATGITNNAEMIFSFSFINSSLEDNKILLKNNPKYRANLEAQTRVNRERLLKGNWKIRPTAGDYFKQSWFETVEVMPKESINTVRYWDRAATKVTERNKDPDWTVGLKLSRTQSGLYYVVDVERFRGSPHEVRQRIKNIAISDGANVAIGLEQEPGASGKTEVQDLINYLTGFNARAFTVSKDKITRALPVSAQSEAGNVKIVRGNWNMDFIKELENFDGDGKKHDDQVDTFSGAFSMLNDNTPISTELYSGGDNDMYYSERESLI
jgi:predicted phage terminase large subunit-like protein